MLSAACISRPGPAWDAAPLATPISLHQAVAPGDLVVLALDAHTNGPMPGSQVLLPSRRLARLADSSGLVRLTSLPSGSYQIRVRRIGYSDWNGTTLVGEGAGTVLVVQLRRQKLVLQQAIVGRSGRPGKAYRSRSVRDDPHRVPEALGRDSGRE
jgi:hypothetical protein